jgi:hypothetical protein
MQLGEAPALDAEALVVGQVPVKDVELDEFHAVQNALDHLEGHEMARRIEQQAAVAEAGLILDVHGAHGEALAPRFHKLREGGHAAQRAHPAGGPQPRAAGRAAAASRRVPPSTLKVS